MDAPIYTHEEEKWNYRSHGLASLLSVGGLLLLLSRAVPDGDIWVIAGITVFSICMTIGFMSSAVYHWMDKPHFKKQLRLLDHVAIYLFIAGSYTPFTLITLRDEYGILLFFLVWGLALAGMMFKYYIRERLDQFVKTDTMIYVLIGCVAVLFTQPLLEVMPAQCVMLLALGGVFYLIGAIFYLWKSFPYNHAIWHFLVMGGALAHYMCVYWYVLPGVS